MIEKGSVVQFIEGHKWVGCLGIVTEDKGHDHPRRYMLKRRAKDERVCED